MPPARLVHEFATAGCITHRKGPNTPTWCNILSKNRRRRSRMSKKGVVGYNHKPLNRHCFTYQKFKVSIDGYYLFSNVYSHSKSSKRRNFVSSWSISLYLWTRSKNNYHYWLKAQSWLLQTRCIIWFRFFCWHKTSIAHYVGVFASFLSSNAHGFELACSSLSPIGDVIKQM